MPNLKHAMIFGAGKTGRGFIGYLCSNSGYTLSFVDVKKSLVDSLNAEKSYPVEILGDASKNAAIENIKAYMLEDNNWLDDFCSAEVAFVSVVGSNFPSLVPYLAEALDKRRGEKPNDVFNIITCENYNNAAKFLRQLMKDNISDSTLLEWINNHVGISESMILCTSLGPASDQNQMTIRTQAFFELPCDGEAFKGSIPDVKGLKPLKKFGNQLERKIYTYNCINAVISYMGGVKGYAQLSEATADAHINATAKQAGSETSKALIAEYGFDVKEQEAWVESAIGKFANRSIPDPIDRNAGDVKRKLSRNDRLIGPALFCLKHNIRPDAILKGIIAAFNYDDNGYKVIQDIEKTGIANVLKNICGLDPSEKLFGLIVEEFGKK